MNRYDIEVVENATNASNILPETPLEKVVADCMTDYLEMRNAEEQGLLLRIECHCKDCKYVNFDGCINTTCYCRKNGCFMQMDDFCKYATKEEAEQALKQMGE